MMPRPFRLDAGNPRAGQADGEGEVSIVIGKPRALSNQLLGTWPIVFRVISSRSGHRMVYRDEAPTQYN
jgi:hypothetical protein